MRTPRLPILLLAVVVTAGACGSAGTGAADASTAPAPPGTATSASAPVGLVGSSWVLATYASDTGSVDAVAEPASSLRFGVDGTVSGSTGCNEFAGTYAEIDADLVISLGPLTLMACATSALTEQEKAVLAGLAATDAYLLSADGGLTLLSAGAQPLLAYAPGDPSP